MVDIVEGSQGKVPHNEVDFPSWVKALAWVVGLCFPVAVMAIVWSASTMIEMKIEMSRMNGVLQAAIDDRYRGSQAEDAHALLDLQIQRNSEDIAELRQLHGRE